MAAIDAREPWTPVRYVRSVQHCDFCWERIEKAVPGRARGTRGTKAWYNPERRVWECMRCRSAGFEAQAAREAAEAAAGTTSPRRPATA